MTPINRQSYMAEISSLLGLITDEDTRAVLIEKMEHMFDAAEDEQKLISDIGSPTKVAVALIRYADNGVVTPEAAVVIDSVTEDELAEADDFGVPGALDAQPELFMSEAETPVDVPEAESEAAEIVETIEAGELPDASETESEHPGEPEESTDPDVTVEIEEVEVTETSEAVIVTDPSEPAVVETVEVVETASAEPETADGAQDELFAPDERAAEPDVSFPIDAASEDAPAVETVIEIEDGGFSAEDEALAEEAAELVEEEARTLIDEAEALEEADETLAETGEAPAEPEAEAQEGDAALTEDAPLTITKVNTFLAILYFIIPGLVIGLPVFLALVVLNLAFLVAAVAVLAAAVLLVLTGLTDLSLPDRLLCFGGAAAGAAIGLVLLWFSIWFVIRVTSGWVRVMTRLGKRISRKEVEIA